MKRGSARGTGDGPPDNFEKLSHLVRFTGILKMNESKNGGSDPLDPFLDPLLCEDGSLG